MVMKSLVKQCFYLFDARHIEPLCGSRFSHSGIKTRVAGIKLIDNAAMVHENDEYHNGALLALSFSTNANESIKKQW